MSTRWHCYHCILLCLTAALVSFSGKAEEPGAGYVPDPELEKLITAAFDTDKAVAFPAQKRLSEIGGAAERALNYKLFAEKGTQARRPYAELIARCCPGRVGYRVTLELTPEGTGTLILESDRTMLAECAQKSDRLNSKPARVFPEDELRRNPYSKVDLAKHITGAMKYTQGSTQESNGRIMANGEVAFTNFDDFASFATSFDRAGYHMLNSIALYDNNDLRTLHFKKSPENDRAKSANFLLMFHDVKWEFVLDFKGQLKSQNSNGKADNRFVWRFNCAQMLNGEAEIEATFDPRSNPKVASSEAPATGAAPTDGLTALVAKKLIRVAVGKRFDPAQEANPNGPDSIAALDGSPNLAKGPDVTCQWVQTSGVPLNLPKEKMTRPVIQMRFYEVGKYTFELTVAQHGQVSVPTEVVILVGETAAEPVAENNGGDGSSAITRKSELPFVKKENAPVAERRAPPESRHEAPEPQAPIHQPEVAQAPARNLRPVSVGNLPAKGILLNEILQEEAEYDARRAGKPIPVAIRPSKKLEEAPPVAQVPSNNVPVASREGPASTPKPEKEATEVAATRIELDDIRREEEQFNRSRPGNKAVTPDVAPAPKSRAIEPVKPVVTQKPVPVAPQVASTEESKSALPPAVKPVAAAPEKSFPPNLKQDVPDTGIEIPSPKPTVSAVKPNAPEVPKPPKMDAPAPAIKPTVPDVAIQKPKVPDVVKPIEPTVAKPAPVPAPEPAKPQPAPAAVAADPAAGQRGMQLTKSGQYSAAVDALKSAIQANPKDEQTQMSLAIALFENAERPDGYDRAGTQAALDVFSDVIRDHEQNAQAYMFAGHCNGRLEHDQEKGMYYKKGYSLGRDKVRWEIQWYLGNKNLKSKDFVSAVSNLTEAEESAGAAGIKNPRLYRDLAAAFHGAKQDNEAIKRVNALWELGYLPDATLVAELRKVTPDAVKVPESAYAPGAAAPAPVAVGSAPTAPTEKIKVALPEAPAVKNGTPVTAQKPTQPEKAAPEVAVAQPATKLVEAKPQLTVANLDEMNSKKITTHDRPNKPVIHAEPVQKPLRAAKPIPLVPETFEAAMEAGKRAMSRGQMLMQKSEEEAKAGDEAAKIKAEALKNDALDCWDEAEVMLRGAWELKPDDTTVKTQFEELAKQIGVIALVKSPLLISKPNGLVVLNAEPSIVFPEGKTMYYAWQQVDGKELNLRREDLDKKTVGLRIKIPGTYKFELVVSDGTRGGNPVAVVVEVR